MFNVGEFLVLILLILAFLQTLSVAGLRDELEKLKSAAKQQGDENDSATGLPEESLRPNNQYKAYREERSKLQDKYFQCSENHTKALATLAAGALGLSITFLHNISGRRPAHIELVPIAWILFGICLWWLAQANNKAKAAFWLGIEITDDAYFHGKIRENPYKDESDAWERKAEVSFWLGVAMLGVFSITNIESSTDMADNSENQKKIVTDYERRSGPTPVPANIIRQPATIDINEGGPTPVPQNIVRRPINQATNTAPTSQPTTNTAQTNTNSEKNE